MSERESELATPSNSESLHENALKEVKDTDGPAMSAAPISTPIASPAYATEEKKDSASTLFEEPLPQDDTPMKDMDEDLDHDLFGGEDDHPANPSESTEKATETEKPLTPPIEEHKVDTVKQEEPASFTTDLTPSTNIITNSSTLTVSEPQKHSRSGTPAEDENPAKRFKSDESTPTVAIPEVSKAPIVHETTSTLPAVGTSTGPKQGLAKHQVKFALASLRAVKRLRDAGPFLTPVDIVKLNIPTYFDFVKNPMDLSTMERKVTAGEYGSAGEFMDDMDLIVNNCVLFNGQESDISNMARNIKTSFDKHMKNMPAFEQAPAPPPKPKRKSMPAVSTPKSQRVAAANLANAQALATPKPAHPQPVQAPHSAPPKAAKASPPAESKPFALQPSGIPTIRRDSSVDGRPKREIHPPRPKDLPYGDVKPRRKKFAAELKFCGVVLKDLMSKKHETYSFPFLEPVDPVALNCPDYFKIIREPMDLSTISQKYNTNQYENADEFERDVRLMFRNCYKFNPEGAPVNIMGHRLEQLFDRRWAEKPITPPTPPPPDHGDSSFDDDSEFDSDDNLELMSNPAIKVLEEQLDRMQKELDRLKKDALREVRDRRRKQKQKKQGSKKPKSSDGNRRKSAPAGRSGGSSQAGPIHVTYEMKKELSEAISTLPEKKMAHVLAVIQESMPQLRNTDQDEIELDIDSLDQGTILKLYNFAVRRDEGSTGGKAKGGSSAGAAHHHNGGSSPGASGAAGGNGSAKQKKKSKPLSEAEQSRQIEQIQRKIQQFDRVENGGAIDVAMSSDDEDDDGSSDDSSSEEE